MLLHPNVKVDANDTRLGQLFGIFSIGKI
jgi:hypothetical protein